MRSRSGALALAQPEESDSRMVMENSARVWRCDAKSPFVLAIADCVTPVVKIPAAVCWRFSAISATRATARPAAREGFREGHDAAQGILVRLVRRRARRAALKHRSHRDVQHLLGNILM